MLPRAMFAASHQSQLKKCLDNDSWHRVAFLGCPVQSQGLDSMILLGPFQLRIFLFWWFLVPKEQLPVPLHVSICPSHFPKACGYDTSLKSQISFAIINQLERLYPVDARGQKEVPLAVKILLSPQLKVYLYFSAVSLNRGHPLLHSPLN